MRLRDVALEQPPHTPPAVLVGTTGERGIAIAARAADGLVVPEGASEAALRWASGLLGGGTLVAYSWLRIEDDAARARAALWPAVRTWRDGGLYPALLARGGELDGPGSAALDRIAVLGDGRDCAAAVRRRAEAGAARSCSSRSAPTRRRRSRASRPRPCRCLANVVRP